MTLRRGFCEAHTPGDVLGHPQVVPTTVLNKIVAGLMGGRKETKKRLSKGKVNFEFLHGWARAHAPSSGYSVYV